MTTTDEARAELKARAERVQRYHPGSAIQMMPDEVLTLIEVSRRVEPPQSNIDAEIALFATIEALLHKKHAARDWNPSTTADEVTDVVVADGWRKVEVTDDAPVPAMALTKEKKMLDALEVKITLPNAWVTEDGVLFMRSYTYAPLRMVFENGNKALEEGCYDERIGFNNFRPPFPRVWVDPAYVGIEQWPDSAVSTQRVEGWVCLYRVDVESLAALGGGEPAPKMGPQPAGDVAQLILHTMLESQHAPNTGALALEIAAALGGGDHAE